MPQPAMLLRGAVSSLRTLGARLLPAGRRHNSTTLFSPGVGPVLITCVGDQRGEPYVGVEFSVSGDLLGMPSYIPLGTDETAEREMIRTFVYAALLTSCDRLHPVYGGVGIEWSVSLPTELESPGVWLPGDVFWSSELDDIDTSLAPDLTEIYGRPGRAFSHGTLIEVGGLLDAQAQSPPQPLRAGRAASSRLARTLSKYFVS